MFDKKPAWGVKAQWQHSHNIYLLLLANKEKKTVFFLPFNISVLLNTYCFSSNLGPISFFLPTLIPSGISSWVRDHVGAQLKIWSYMQSLCNRSKTKSAQGDVYHPAVVFYNHAGLFWANHSAFQVSELAWVMTATPFQLKGLFTFYFKLTKIISSRQRERTWKSSLCMLFLDSRM